MTIEYAMPGQLGATVVRPPVTVFGGLLVGSPKPSAPIYVTLPPLMSAHAGIPISAEADVAAPTAVTIETARTARNLFINPSPLSLLLDDLEHAGDAERPWRVLHGLRRRPSDRDRDIRVHESLRHQVVGERLAVEGRDRRGVAGHPADGRQEIRR